MDYRAIFNHRGMAYDAAMQAYPEARASEFRELFAGLELSDGLDVLDVPAGGGYLKPYLPPNTRLHEFEFSEGFSDESAAVKFIFTVFELPRAVFDMALSLAALHHIHDKAAFFAAMSGAVRSGGTICVADVAEGSAEAAFLDGFVGEHNGSGHHGDYMHCDASYLNALVADLPVTLRLVETRDCPWWFRTRSEMLDFVKLLFHMPDIGDVELYSELQNSLGVFRKAGGLALRWSLIYAVLDVG